MAKISAALRALPPVIEIVMATNMNKILSLIFLLIICTGCSSIDLAPDEKHVPLAYTNVNLIENIYLNHMPNSRANLWEFLLYSEEDDVGKYLGLSFHDENNLEVFLLDENKNKVASQIIEGSFKNGYYHFDRRYKFMNFYLLFNGFGSKDCRIGINYENDLVIESCAEGNLFLIVFPIFGAGGYSRRSTYRQAITNGWK